jgi:hypothetical protein
VNSLQIKRSLFGNHNLRRERETTIPMKKMGERDRERQRETDFDEAGHCMNVNLITGDNPPIQLLPNKTFMAVFGIDPENAFNLQT